MSVNAIEWRKLDNAGFVRQTGFVGGRKTFEIVREQSDYGGLALRVLDPALDDPYLQIPGISYRELKDLAIKIVSVKRARI